MKTRSGVLRRLLVSWVLVLAAVGSAHASDGDASVRKPESSVPGKRGRPNILIIVADDLGYREVGGAENSPSYTPNIDRLAAQGVRFDRAFVPTAMCSPSRAALYTGLYPHRNGLFRNHSQAKGGTRSMPHYFAELGYRVALAGKVHVGPPASFPFELIDLSTRSIEKFVEADADRPFLVVAAQHYPHVPWVANRIYDEKTLRLPAKFIDTPQTREAFGRYCASVTRGDEEVGRIIALMDAKGLADSTIVVFLSDHGPQFPFMKFSNYEAGLKVPLIVRWPGIVRAGGTSHALVSSIDLLPTLIELAGGVPAADIDGRSLVRVLTGAASTHRDRVFGAHSNAGLVAVSDEPYGIRSVRTERFRYIRNLHSQNRQRTLITEARPLRGSINYLLEFGSWMSPGVPAYWQSWEQAAVTDARARGIVGAYWNRPAEELYDVKADPDEMTNLAVLPQYQNVLREMRDSLDAWMQAQGDAGQSAG